MGRGVPALYPSVADTSRGAATSCTRFEWGKHPEIHEPRVAREGLVGLHRETTCAQTLCGYAQPPPQGNSAKLGAKDVEASTEPSAQDFSL